MEGIKGVFDNGEGIGKRRENRRDG